MLKGLTTCLAIKIGDEALLAILNCICSIFTGTIHTFGIFDWLNPSGHTMAMGST